jgi:transposase-like protein
MACGKLRPTLEEVNAPLAVDQHCLRPLAHTVLQQFLEAEMNEALGAEAARLGYGSGYTPARW